jgi:8-oxo-dGTP pyrophosphatase MutT (NUDIX family)
MAHIHELYDYTTSAFILHPTEKKILLLHHKKLNKWLQPGGHVELHENPLQALQHELEEEAGLTPNDYTIIEPADHPRPSGNNVVLPLPFYFNEHLFTSESNHRHIDICYLARAHTSKLTDSPDGAHAIAWLTLEEIRAKHVEDLLFTDTLEICEWIWNNVA